MTNRIVLVTGGAGFIGSAVIRHIINNTNDVVINVDKLTYAGNLDSLSEVQNSPRYYFEHADICDAKSIVAIFKKYKPSHVMHLAAESHVDRSIDGPGVFMQTNIIGTYTLLEAVRGYLANSAESFAREFRFHHISTDEVYGDLYGTSNLFVEETPYAPSSPYAASKASSDHLVRAWGRTFNLPVVISNCSNNYGPYHFPEKLIPLIILNAMDGKPLPVYGKGEQIRDWLYVEDHARALYLVLTQSMPGKTYNIGGHNEKKNIEVVRSICELLEELKPVSGNPNMQQIKKYADLISHVQDRPGHDGRYAIDANKIKNELGWQPKETFETGLRKTVQWYLDNELWWQRIQTRNNQTKRLGLGEK